MACVCGGVSSAQGGSLLHAHSVYGFVVCGLFPTTCSHSVVNFGVFPYYMLLRNSPTRCMHATAHRHTCYTPLPTRSPNSSAAPLYPHSLIFLAPECPT